MRLLATTILLSLTLCAHSQDKKKIKFSEILELIYTSAGDTLEISGYDIENNLYPYFGATPDEAASGIFDETGGGFLKRKFTNLQSTGDTLVFINKLVVFTGNKLPRQFGFTEIGFKELIIRGNEMENTVILLENFATERLVIVGPTSSWIDIYYSSIQRLSTYNSTLNSVKSSFSEMTIGGSDATINSVEIIDSEFTNPSGPYYDYCTPKDSSMVKDFNRENKAITITGQVQRLIFNNNIINQADSIRTIDLGCSSNELFVTNNNLNGNILTFSNGAAQRFILTKNVEVGETSFLGFLFNKEGSQIDWPTIAGSVSNFYRLDVDFEESGHQVCGDQSYYALYRPTQPGDFVNNDRYNQFVQSYNSLLGLFKEQGNLEYYNSCLVELKDLQVARLKYLYNQNNSFNNFFRWQLNKLMKVYTEHGTDPAKAITISMYVVMLFGVFYFFFPSDWDVTSKANLIKNYKDFIEKNDKGYFKPFFQLTMGFLVSLINAFTLSLNSFTTLGFGNIPTHGIARYVCVVEGFIGWFLLSLFTVALINQVVN